MVVAKSVGDECRQTTWGQKGYRCIGAQACGGPASDVGRRLGVPLDAGDKANNDGRDCITRPADKEFRVPPRGGRRPSRTMNDVSSHTVLSPMSHHQDANQIWTTSFYWTPYW